MTLHHQDIPLLRELRATRRQTRLDEFASNLSQARREACRAANHAREIEQRLADQLLVALECYEAGECIFNGRAELGRRSMWLVTDLDTGSTISFPAEMIPTAAMIRDEMERVRARFRDAEAAELTHGSQS